MNKKAALLLSFALISTGAQADFIGATFEVGSYDPDADLTLKDDGSNPATNESSLEGEKGTYYGIAIEHPIPLIPNVRLQGTSLESEGTISTFYNGNTVSNEDAKIDLSHTDYTAYYEFLDGLFWLHLDAGVTVRSYDGSVDINGDSTDLSVSIPMLYIAPSIAIPGTGFSIGAEIKELSFDDNSITDTIFKVKWDSGYLIGIEGGIRTHKIELDDVAGLDINSTNEGYFVGVVIDI